MCVCVYVVTLQFSLKKLAVSPIQSSGMVGELRILDESETDSVRRDMHKARARARAKARAAGFRGQEGDDIQVGSASYA